MNLFILKLKCINKKHEQSDNKKHEQSDNKKHEQSDNTYSILENEYNQQKYTKLIIFPKNGTKLSNTIWI